VLVQSSRFINPQKTGRYECMYLGGEAVPVPIVAPVALLLEDTNIV